MRKGIKKAALKNNAIFQRLRHERERVRERENEGVSERERESRQSNAHQ